MKKSKEYQICIALFSVALVLFVISFISGLIPNLNLSIDKISMYLGFACFGFGLAFLKKYEKSNNDKEQ